MSRVGLLILNHPPPELGKSVFAVCFADARASQAVAVRVDWNGVPGTDRSFLCRVSKNYAEKDALKKRLREELCRCIVPPVRQGLGEGVCLMTGILLLDRESRKVRPFPALDASICCRYDRTDTWYTYLLHKSTDTVAPRPSSIGPPLATLHNPVSTVPSADQQTHFVAPKTLDPLSSQPPSGQVLVLRLLAVTTVP
ncbi:hypothetical protein LZ30DRAFT_688373 [Colletotrichum cereale]|nr:hypothetical protein LZ30DRAFT_688373 [Colletotrichum cereale]